MKDRGKIIRRFILENVEENPAIIVKKTQDTFKNTRQAVNRHTKLLIEQGLLEADGVTRGRRYWLKAVQQKSLSLRLNSGIPAETIWRTEFAQSVENLPNHLVDIWQFGFCHMLNNAQEHGGGKIAVVNLTQTAVATQITFQDDGRGLFKRIQERLHLANEQAVIALLGKAKLTTNPTNHKGLGIIAASQLFDYFVIASHGLFFSHPPTAIEKWIYPPVQEGTGIFMRLSNQAQVTLPTILATLA